MCHVQMDRFIYKFMYMYNTDIWFCLLKIMDSFPCHGY